MIDGLIDLIYACSDPSWYACVSVTVYVDHLHKKHNNVVLVHGLEIPSLPTRECMSAMFFISLSIII